MAKIVLRAGMQCIYKDAHNPTNEGMVVTLLYPYLGGDDNKWAYGGPRWVIDRFARTSCGVNINHIAASRLVPAITTHEA